MKNIFSRTSVKKHKKKAKRKVVFKRGTSVLIAIVLIVGIINLAVFAQETSMAPEPVLDEPVAEAPVELTPETPEMSEPPIEEPAPSDAPEPPAPEEGNGELVEVMPEESAAADIVESAAVQTIEEPAARPAADIPVTATMTSLKINGNDISPNTVIDVKKDQVISISYSWHVPSGTLVQPGDTSNIDLWSGMPIRPVPSANLENAAGVKLGTIDIALTNGKGKATITYAEGAQGLQDISGTFTVTTTIDIDEITSGGNGSFTIGDNEYFYVLIPDIPAGSATVVKSHVSTNIAAKKIDWSVDVNMDRKTLTSATLTDTIPEAYGANGDHNFDQASVKVYNLVLKADKSGYELGGEYSGFTVNFNGKTMTVDLGNINSAYRVVYSTNADWNSAGYYYYNTATFNGSSSTIFIQKPGNISSVTKSGWYRPTNTDGSPTPFIIWTIELNRNADTLSSLDIADVIDANQEYIGGSAQLHEAQYKGATTDLEAVGSPISGFEISASGSNLSFTLPKNNQAYILVYKTKVTGVAETYKNTVKQPGSGDVTATAFRNGEIVSEPSLRKSYNASDERTNIQWRIELTAGSSVTENIVFKDTFSSPSGCDMQLKQDSFNVYILGKGSLSKGTDYFITPIKGDINYTKGFVITFSDSIKLQRLDTLTIQYYVDLIRPISNGQIQGGQFWNYVNGTYKVEGVTVEQSGQCPKTIDPLDALGLTKHASFKPGSNLIEWQIGVNTSKINLGEGIKLTDVYSSGQEFKADSFSIKKDAIYDVTGDASLYTLTPTANGFDLVFNKAVDINYLVTYYTKPLGTIQAQYTNVATLTQGSASKTVSATCAFKPADSSVITKSGAISRVDANNLQRMKWDIVVNKDSFEVENAKITDTLSKGHIIDRSTIAVYDGTSASGTPVSDYSVSVSGDSSGGSVLTIAFNSNITSPRYVTYETVLDKKNAEQSGSNYVVRNSATFTGTGISASSTDSVDNSISSVTGGMDGISAGIAITKLDGTNSTPLKGAIFEIYQNGQLIATTALTGADGKVSVDRLLYGEYKVKEKFAPAGYDINSTEQTVTLSSGNGSAAITFINYPIGQAVKSLTIFKYDYDTPEGMNKLAGAVFEVKQGDTLIGTLTTDAEGKATIELNPGNYTVTEITAPTGYALDSTPKNIEVKADDTQGYVSKFYNEKLYKLEVIKVDKDSRANLSGAKFTVKNSNNSLIGEITTDSNGKGTIADLKSGTYTLTETQAPAGYKPLAADISVTVGSNTANAQAVVSKIIENEKQSSILTINKVDAEGNSPLAGAEYKVEQNGSAVAGSPFTTNTNGQATVNLLPGTYKVTETKAPNGYSLSNAVQDVTITAGENSKSITFENEKLYTLEITKIDKDSRANLSGAVFSVKDGNGTAKGDITTGADGKGTLAGLTRGSYTISEKTAPAGYAPLSADIIVTVDKASANAQAIVSKTIENSKKFEKLTIKKVDAAGNAPLAGAVFDVKAKGSDTVIGSVTTNINGIATIDLSPGDYTVTEKTPPTGYSLNKTPQDISIPDPGSVQAPQGAAYELTFKNDKLYALQITKVDKESREPLSGAVFEVKDSNGTLVETTSPTTDQGKARIELAAGSYTITEKTAPAGYAKADAPKSVTIDPINAGQGVVFVFENEKQPAPNPNPSPSPSASPSPSPSPSPSVTPTPVPSVSPTPTTSNEPTGPTATPRPPSPSPSTTPTAAPSPSTTPTAAPSPSATPTASPSPTVTPTPTPTITPEEEPTPAPTTAPTAAPSPQATETPTVLVPPIGGNTEDPPPPDTPATPDDDNGGTAGTIGTPEDPGNGDGNVALSDDGQNIPLTSQPQNVGQLLQDLAGGKVPLGSLGLGNAWSLLNLLMSLFAAICAIVVFVTLFHKKRANSTDENDQDEASLPVEERLDEENEEGKPLKSRLKTLKIIAILGGLIPGILFLILEDITLPVTWVTRWTPLIAAFFILAMVLLLIQFAIKKKNKQTPEEEGDVEEQAPNAPQLS